MPSKGTPRREVRIADEEWEAFGEAAGDRSAVLRMFIAWYLRRRGAKLPVRPPRADPHDPAKVTL